MMYRFLLVRLNRDSERRTMVLHIDGDVYCKYTIAHIWNISNLATSSVLESLWFSRRLKDAGTLFQSCTTIG